MMGKIKRVAAVHDLSCFGRGSLTTAIPVLSAGGLSVCPLPTALLSTHTDENFKEFSFLDLTDELQKILSHWKRLSLSFDCIYTGYLGSARQIGIVTDLIACFQHNSTLICVDPVMADNGRLYTGFDLQMVQGMRSLVKSAHLITPNLTEAFLLLDMPYEEHPDMRKIRDMLGALGEGGKQAIITGIPDGENLGSAFLDPQSGEALYIGAKNLSHHFCGAGDLFTSILLCRLLNGSLLKESVEKSVSFCQKAMENTLLSGNPPHYGIEFEGLLGGLREIGCGNIQIKNI